MAFVRSKSLAHTLNQETSHMYIASSEQNTPASLTPQSDHICAPVLVGEILSTTNLGMDL